MEDIDDLIKDEEEEKQKHGSQPEDKELEDAGNITDDSDNEAVADEDSNDDRSRRLIGTVEKFFSNINVAAINLTDNLEVGDLIEISDEYGKLQMVVLSMQIDKSNVESAYAGDSVGIKVDGPVKEGSKVYKVG